MLFIFIKTEYDKLPSGLETEDRANVSRLMNNKKFTGQELRKLYFYQYKQKSSRYKLSIPFVDFLWDMGVEEYLKKNKEVKKI